MRAPACVVSSKPAGQGKGTGPRADVFIKSKRAGYRLHRNHEQGCKQDLRGKIQARAWFRKSEAMGLEALVPFSNSPFFVDLNKGEAAKGREMDHKHEVCCSASFTVNMETTVGHSSHASWNGKRFLNRPFKTCREWPPSLPVQGPTEAQVGYPYLYI